MKQIAWGIVAVGLFSTPAFAQEVQRPHEGLVLRSAAAVSSAAAAVQAPAAPEKNWSVTLGTDMPTAYYFRGFVQETEGFIAQPFITVGVTPSDTVSLSFGMWNSLHSSESTGTFYEADYFATLGLTAGQWAPGVTFTSYTSPNDTFETINEVAFSLGFDDSGSTVPVSPTVTVAVDDNKTAYLQLGMGPSFSASESVSVSIPTTVGLSLKDYYGGDTFGFFSVGLTVGVALPQGWEVHGGVSLIALGDAIQFDDDSVKPVANFGLSVGF